MSVLHPPKVVLVHDWTIHMRGGEKVLEAFAELFPDATLYTLFYDRKQLSPRLQKLKIKASFLQWLPGIKKYYRWLLPIFPWIISTLKIDSDAQWVISSSHCVAKGIPVPKGALHVCYCHTPMRYAWVAEEVYFQGFAAPFRWIIHQILKALKKWDAAKSQSVDLFIANSAYIAARIQKAYGRSSEVVHPPYDDAFFKPVAVQSDYYFAISHFVPYKRLDIVIEAFNQLNRNLIVAGSGPLDRAYRALALSPKISFTGFVSDDELRRLYSGAKAVLFPAEEDFGIVPLEAQACGAPVIAYGRGGALESVKTGLFFEAQTPEAVFQAVEKFESLSFPSEDICGKISGFRRAVFLSRVQAVIKKAAEMKYAEPSAT